MSTFGARHLLSLFSTVKKNLLKIFRDSNPFIYFHFLQLCISIFVQLYKKILTRFSDEDNYFSWMFEEAVS